MAARALVVFLLAAGAAPSAGALNLLPSQLDSPLDATWHAPSSQAFLDFLPKGDLGDTGFDWELAPWEFAAGLVLSTGGAVLATTINNSDKTWDIWSMRQALFGATAIEFGAMPLLVNTAVWGIGEISFGEEPGFWVPLLANYAMELVLGVLRSAVIYSVLDLHHGEQVKSGVDVLGFYLYVDWALHALLSPTVAVFFSQRARDARNDLGDARRGPLPRLAAAVRPTYRSASDEREDDSRRSAPTVGWQFPLATVAF